MFTSADDLVLKTPNFYQTASKRLNETLGGAYRYEQRHFGGQNLYLEEVDRNIRFAKTIVEKGDMSMLKRKPPGTLCGEGDNEIKDDETK